MGVSVGSAVAAIDEVGLAVGAAPPPPPTRSSASGRKNRPAAAMTSTPTQRITRGIPGSPARVLIVGYASYRRAVSHDGPSWSCGWLAALDRVELTVGRRPEAVVVGCDPVGGRVSGASLGVPRAAAGATRPAR